MPGRPGWAKTGLMRCANVGCFSVPSVPCEGARWNAARFERLLFDRSLNSLRRSCADSRPSAAFREAADPSIRGSNRRVAALLGP